MTSDNISEDGSSLTLEKENKIIVKIIHTKIKTLGQVTTNKTYKITLKRTVEIEVMTSCSFPGE